MTAVAVIVPKIFKKNLLAAAAADMADTGFVGPLH
jgi:hypothetical protein